MPTEIAAFPLKNGVYKIGTWDRFASLRKSFWD
jgi:hypothetical protein